MSSGNHDARRVTSLRLIPVLRCASLISYSILFRFFRLVFEFYFDNSIFVNSEISLDEEFILIYFISSASVLLLTN